MAPTRLDKKVTVAPNQFVAKLYVLGKKFVDQPYTLTDLLPDEVSPIPVRVVGFLDPRTLLPENGGVLLVFGPFEVLPEQVLFQFEDTLLDEGASAVVATGLGPVALAARVKVTGAVQVAFQPLQIEVGVSYDPDGSDVTLGDLTYLHLRPALSGQGSLNAFAAAGVGSEILLAGLAAQGEARALLQPSLNLQVYFKGRLSPAFALEDVDIQRAWIQLDACYAFRGAITAGIIVPDLNIAIGVGDGMVIQGTSVPGSPFVLLGYPPPLVTPDCSILDSPERRRATLTPLPDTGLIPPWLKDETGLSIPHMAHEAHPPARRSTAVGHNDTDQPADHPVAPMDQGIPEEESVANTPSNTTRFSGQIQNVPDHLGSARTLNATQQHASPESVALGMLNGNFAVSGSHNPQFGWQVRGSTTVVDGVAVLNEDDRVCTGFSQTFVVPDGARVLRFTMRDASFGANGSKQPPDVFEVALLDSASLLPLVGKAVGLGHTDALLNMQQTGEVFFAPGVRVPGVAVSGQAASLRFPLTIEVDLHRAAPGTRATLFFDLLGFKPTSSSVVLDDVSLLTEGMVTPGADAGGPYTGTVDEPVTFDGSGSFDADGTIVLYEWDFESDGVFDFSSTVPMATHVYTTEFMGTLTLRVTDNDGRMSTDTAPVEVQARVNQPPVLQTIADQSMDESATLTVPVSALDPERTLLTLSVSGLPAFASFTANSNGTGALVFTPGFTDAGIYPLTVSVTDGSLTTFSTFTLTVKDVNRRPTANAGGPYVAHEGDPVLLDGTGSSDPDGDSLDYRWNFVDGTAGSGSTVTHAYADNGIYIPVLTVTDPSGLNHTGTSVVTVTNVPPMVDVGLNATIHQGDTFSRTGSFTDPGADTWTATIDYGDDAGGQPLALHPDKTFALSHTYTESGLFTVTVTVLDDDGGVGSDTMMVSVLAQNRPPSCPTARPSLASLWPPNHKFVSITILGVTDPEGNEAPITITSIRQDEPVDTPGHDDGSFAPDGKGVGTNTAQVRAERAGSGNGRVYHLFFTAKDGQGGTCTGEVLVGVPHDQGQGSVPVDDGARYDSTQSKDHDEAHKSHRAHKSHKGHKN
jgi:PKD repeat protein